MACGSDVRGWEVNKGVHELKFNKWIHLGVAMACDIPMQNHCEPSAVTSKGRECLSEACARTHYESSGLPVDPREVNNRLAATSPIFSLGMVQVKCMIYTTRPYMMGPFMDESCCKEPRKETILAIWCVPLHFRLWKGTNDSMRTSYMKFAVLPIKWSWSDQQSAWTIHTPLNVIKSHKFALRSIVIWSLDWWSISLFFLYIKLWNKCTTDLSIQFLWLKGTNKMKRKVVQDSNELYEA